jgi:hypothetical protein
MMSSLWTESEGGAPGKRQANYRMLYVVLFHVLRIEVVDISGAAEPMETILRSICPLLGRVLWIRNRKEASGNDA